MPLDVTDGDGVDRMGQALFERWGRLDNLILNGGALGQLGPIAHYDPELWDEVMAVNVNANQRYAQPGPAAPPIAGGAVISDLRRGHRRPALLGRLRRQQGGAGGGGPLLRR